jgi:hypothetical protein
MDPIQAIGKLADNIRVLNVPRIEDLPYFTSAPIQFNYTETANIAGGTYPFAGTQQPMTTVRPLINGALYYIKNISLSANVDEGAYMSGAAINAGFAPKFQIYLQSDAGSQFLREPILVNRYFYQFEFKKFFLNQQSNAMLASITGAVIQVPALVGLAALSIVATINAVEIMDTNFIQLFTGQPYPQVKP